MMPRERLPQAGKSLGSHLYEDLKQNQETAQEEKYAE
jgi:hypothetical protein